MSRSFFVCDGSGRFFVLLHTNCVRPGAKSCVGALLFLTEEEIKAVRACFLEPRDFFS